MEVKTLTDLLLTHRLGWDWTEEANWARRDFFRGSLGPLAPNSQPFPRGPAGEGGRGGQEWRAPFVGREAPAFEGGL